MLPKKADDLAFSVLRDIYDLPSEDLANVDPAKFSERIRDIHRGYSAESEFAAIASWLGHCSLLTHPDEVLHTDGSYGVPDYLVVVSRESRSVSFLVEVKTTEKDRLVWGAKYHAKMEKFSQLLVKPLLVAWRRHGLWTLNDVSLFEKRETAFHLSFESAMENNLMGMLFGNVWIRLREGFRMELGIEILDPVVDETSDVLPERTYECVVREAGFYTDKGKVEKDLSSGLFLLLLAKGAEPRIERQGRHLRQIFPTDPEGMFNSSDLLFASLSWKRSEGEEVDWLAEIRKGLPIPQVDLRESLRQALEAGAVQYIFDQKPHYVPPFLEKWLGEDADRKEPSH
jgi:hypothetical protein